MERIFEFLIDLKFNNNKTWFKDNYTRYKEARSTFEEFIGILLTELKKLDKSIDVDSPGECIFRINRDIRFSKNKEPYKTNFGALIAHGGRKRSYAGYYVHIEPDSSFIGGGIYMPEPNILKDIRTEIFENTEEYRKIIDSKEFRKYFPEIYGEKLKLAPKGFPKDFNEIDLLKNKHYAVAYPVNNSFFMDNDVVEKIMDIFRVQYPFNNFLNRVFK